MKLIRKAISKDEIFQMCLKFRKALETPEEIQRRRTRNGGGINVELTSEDDKLMFMSKWKNNQINSADQITSQMHQKWEEEQWEDYEEPTE